jgi:hypothetical protein
METALKTNAVQATNKSDGVKRVALILLRVIGAVGGGYAFSAAAVAFGAIALSLSTPLARGEAAILMAMLGFVVYLVALLWGFSARRVWLVWLVLFGGAGCFYLLTRLLLPLLPAMGEVK